MLSSSKPALLRALPFLIACHLAQAHVVSMSNGELHITGTTATYELRMPAYEVAALPNPETTLLDSIRFGDARRLSSECKQEQDSYICHATYEFPAPIPDKLEVECNLFRVTVPNHIHMLYVVQGHNGDQRVFDQNKTVIEMRFHPPSVWESLTREGGAGALRLLTSVAGLLFLAVIALAARGARDAALLTVAFLASEWAIRPIAPLIPLSMSPEFLEAVMALTVAYMAGELLLMPSGRARWLLVPVLGLIHGLPFVAFPPLYLTGAALLQALLLAVLTYVASKMPAAWRKPAAGLLLGIAALWFTKLVWV
ncbi:MAG: HupE/UreJ family protein [Acidobacteriota bacterium]